MKLLLSVACALATLQVATLADTQDAAPLEVEEEILEAEETNLAKVRHLFLRLTRLVNSQGMHMLCVDGQAGLQFSVSRDRGRGEE